MAKNNNLTDFLTDVANAIREKDGSTGTINPQDFSDKIKAIQTGVDTSDATATSADILKDKTAYVKGTKVTGAIETYDGSFDNLPVIDVVKGDIVTIESKQYRVLNVNGAVAEVLGLYSASYLRYDSTGSIVVFTGGTSGLQYRGSTLDVYLNETFFTTLSATMQAAIVPKAITQDMWGYSDSAPSSGTYYHQTYGSSNRYYYDNEAGVSYGTAEVGSRNVYALSVREVIDYLGVPENGDFTDTDIREMFDVAAKPRATWLRTSAVGGTNGMTVAGNHAYMRAYYCQYSENVSPAFQIDLSKIAYTKN